VRTLALYVEPSRVHPWAVKRLALALEAARTTRSRIAKEQALGEALASIAHGPEEDTDLALATATRVATGRALPTGDGRSAGAGFSLWLDVASALPGFSASVVRADARKAGDLGEALALLAARTPSAAERPGLRLDEVAQLFEALASTGQRADKRRLLLDAVTKASPIEVKYLAKVLLGGMRTGMQEGVVQGAIARAFSAPVAEVRRAMALVGDPGLTAVLAHHGRLADATLELGRPVAFMLATPIETLAKEIDTGGFVIEDKIDGVRAQAHKRGGDVVLFARGMDRVTAAFPEVAEALAAARGDVALDGEIVARDENGKPRPFQSLQPRLRRLTPQAELLAEAPVTLLVYDFLADASGSALDLPWTERRAKLEAFIGALPPHPAIALHPYRPASDVTVDTAFADARAKGFEGLVLKRMDARYEAGRRGQAWLKVKRAYATLDVVVTGAEEGHGRRAGVLSDYTFAVWSGDALVNVGKAYTGLTDEEIRSMTERLLALTVDHAGGVRLVRPEIVLEVAFDGVQPSARHESGFALRFPRIVRVRDDKTASEADRLEAVQAIFAAQVAEGHREEAPVRKARNRPRENKPPKENRQLDLFGGGGKKR
jgi:DNA ligase 1